MNSLRVITNRLAVPIHSVLAQPQPTQEPDSGVAELETLVRSHHYDRAFRRGEEMLGSTASPIGLAFVLHYQGHALLRLGEPWKALDRLHDARQLFESIGDGEAVVKTMELEARALHLAEDERALSVAEAALARCQTLDPQQPAVESELLRWIGTMLVGRRNHIEARTKFDEALRAAGSVRDLTTMARIYHDLGFCYLQLGDLGRAIDLVQKAETLYEAELRISEAPPNVELPRVQNDLGMLLMEQGDLHRAEQRIESAIRAIDELGQARTKSYMLLSMAELRHKQGRQGDGVLLAEEAIALARQLNETRSLAAGYKHLGTLHAALGELDLAVQDFKRALAILDEAGLEQRRIECMQAYERALGAPYQADVAAGA